MKIRESQHKLYASYLRSNRTVRELLSFSLGGESFDPIFVGRGAFTVDREPSNPKDLIQRVGQKIYLANWPGVTSDVQPDHFMLEWDAKQRLYVVTEGNGRVTIQGRSVQNGNKYSLYSTGTRILVSPTLPTIRFEPEYGVS